MKLLPHSTFLLILFSVAISCHKTEVEPLFTDPTNLPQPPHGCRIVKTIYKVMNNSKKQLPDAETISIENGPRVRIGTGVTTTYSYDDLGRLLEEKNSQFIIKYSYRLNKIFIQRMWFDTNKANNMMADQVKEYNLNNWGKIIADSTSKETYDALGNIIQITNATSTSFYDYNIGNLIQYTLDFRSGSEKDIPTTLTRRGALIISYSYLPNRPNLPQIKSFESSHSKNLLLKKVIEAKESGEWGEGKLYQINYSYLYDKQGRVKRQIKYGYSLSPLWLTEEDPSGISVTDYEYECP
ncbi:hypothetical protein [Larkinella soli]|uniref:hypothetical protein n=1 Tax=Larkinella soli TaxID=1770527 RepID=UPI000FFB3BEA|nr:hypothetical protein [Larkinella soli]